MKAVVLLSGGIDSATTLYYARSRGYKVSCLTFDYGQRHKKEIYCAKNIAGRAGAGWELLRIALPWKGSSLIDTHIKLPGGRLKRSGIPSTYVPGRNIIFLSYAVSYAESIGADAVFIGANQIDYSGYPDCRQGFIEAFELSATKGTKRGVTGGSIKIKAPLIRKNKSEIIRLARRLNVPLKFTWSCYEGKAMPCMKCDSCIIRLKGFKEAGMKDPLSYG